MSKKALVLGITGQDGSYLAEILLEKGYEVHGLIRRSATGNKRNIEHLLQKITLHRGDLADATSLFRVIQQVRPHEVYNEADQDHVSWSYDSVDYSCDITGAAVGRILESIRQIDPSIKFFQPCSSNMFGKSEEPQNELSPFRPQSPYGCAKVLAFTLARYYRDVFGMFVATAIFYNHESPRRTTEYVTRKITQGAARIAMGLQKELVLGDLDVEIDFGYAREYMEAAYEIMQLERADDFVLCTGEVHSLRSLLNEAFRYVGLDANDYVRCDPAFFRPGKTSTLRGDASKARGAFGFAPRVRLPELVKVMMDHDLALAEAERRARLPLGAESGDGASRGKAPSPQPEIFPS